MIKIHKVLIDIRNYFTLRKIAKRESLSSPIWAKQGLRMDWIGRIYTVYNLPPEVTKSPDIPKGAWIAYVIDQAKPLNQYLTDLNLQEILEPDYREIPDSESYLLIYKPYFQVLGWSWIITRSLFWAGIFFIQHKFHFFTNLYHWVHNLL